MGFGLALGLAGAMASVVDSYFPSSWTDNNTDR